VRVFCTIFRPGRSNLLRGRRKEAVESRGRARRHRTAQKAKNLQELYIAASRILELNRRSSGRIDFHREESGMDAIYLLMLAVLYAATHALVWALERLGKTS
jgi:hypothetical protein